MNYQAVTPTREMPRSDTLFRFDDSTYIRLRLTAKTTDGSVRTEAPEPGVAETINVKLQCSLCKDGSGDVRTDANGNHLLLAAEVHSATVDALMAGNISFEAWLANRTDEILQKARRKAYVIDQVLSRYLLPSI